MIKVGYSDFIKLCRLDDPADWSRYAVEHDGVYVVPPPDDASITPNERAVFTLASTVEVAPEVA